MARSRSTESAEPAGFDVREFARTAHGSLRDDLDLASFAEAPLPADVRAELAALAVLEGATMAHLRNVLVTHTHKDARVTAFLVTWAYEKFWIADALRAIVDTSAGPSSGRPAGGRATPVPIPPAGDAAQPTDPEPQRATSGGRGPVRRAFAGFTQGWAVVGAHMALGLVDDLVLGAAYTRVAESSADAALHAAVERIVAVKRRHTQFFDEEVRRRLPTSARAARLARRELRRTTWPLGSAALAGDERMAFARFTFGGADGIALAADLERAIAALPGVDARTAAIVLRGLAGRRAS
jgi:hypothetical protein